VQVGVLGPIELFDDAGDVHAIGSPNQRIVLGVLASRGGSVVSAETLIDAIWGDEIPKSALQSLRTYVSRLRRILGDALVSAPGGYRLELESDAAVFEAQIHQTSTEQPDKGVDTLRSALSLWRGHPYMGLEDVASVAGEIRRLDELQQSAREALAAGLLESGQAATAVAEAESLLADAPLREGAWAVLVHALTADDRPADALRAVNRAVSELAEAGLEPSPALRSAESQALAGAPVEPPPRWRAPVRHTSLVGRDDAIMEVSELLDSARAVTLVGPGGVGKTSLATMVAKHRQDDHRQGVRFVELAAVRNPMAVPSTILDGLGMTRGAADTDAALAGAGTLDALLVLDNCEHLLDAVENK